MAKVIDSAVVRLVLLAVGGFMLLMLWQQAFDQRTSTRNVETFFLSESANDAPAYVWSGEIFRVCPVELRRWIVDNDDITHELPSIRSIAPIKTGLQSSRRSIAAPYTVSRAGPFTYHVRECARCNLWQRFVEPQCENYPPVWVPPIGYKTHGD
jgi:hypothetical protein